MTIGTIISIAAAAACLAHTAAERRNREAGVWAVLAFLCPLTLLVIWSLGYREDESPAKMAG
jgi:hypothetical protein